MFGRPRLGGGAFQPGAHHDRFPQDAVREFPHAAAPARDRVHQPQPVEHAQGFADGGLAGPKLFRQREFDEPVPRRVVAGGDALGEEVADLAGEAGAVKFGGWHGFVPGEETDAACKETRDYR